MIFPIIALCVSSFALGWTVRSSVYQFLRWRALGSLAKAVQQALDDSNSEETK